MDARQLYRESLGHDLDRLNDGANVIFDSQIYSNHSNSNACSHLGEMIAYI